MSISAHVSEFVKTHMEEATKTYSVFDGSNRLEYFYVAHIDIKDGEQCMCTQYTYDSTSARIVKTKESKASWDSAWDI